MKKMNFTLMPSLMHISLVKVAISLWNKDDIATLIEGFNFKDFRSELEGDYMWQEIENKVVQNVSKLLLPKTLKNEILGLIKPVGIHIAEWFEYHVSFGFLNLSLPNKLRWTLLGTVDKKRTAEVLVNDESLDITHRYKLACIYCFENDIPLLWNKMPEDSKINFYSEKELQAIEPAVFWIYHLKGEEAKLKNMLSWQSNCATYYQHAFKCAVYSGNKVAAEYFFPKLTPHQREHDLIIYARFTIELAYCSVHPTNFTKVRYIDLLCFLLSKLKERQQIKTFKYLGYYVLNTLLVWPWQDFFMKATEILLNFLSEKEYGRLLSDIAIRVRVGYRDCQKLFLMFWQQSPETYKKYVIHQCTSDCSLLLELFKIEDIQNVALILKSATVTERAKIIFCSAGKEICFRFIYFDAWHLLQFFVLQCIPSKSLMIQFKEELNELMKPHTSKEVVKERDFCGKSSQFLDSLYLDDKKRSAEDGDSKHSVENSMELDTLY